MRTTSLRRRRVLRSLTLALLLTLAATQNLYACLSACMIKYGDLQKLNGYWYEYVYCDERYQSDGTGTIITCYFRNTGIPVGGVYPE